MTENLEKNKRPRGAFAGIFLLGAALFLIGAAVAFFTVIRPLMLLDRARSWVETPAEILSLELQRNRGSKGGTTYQIKMRYRYQFNGKTHDSERFTALGGFDNTSSYHQKHYHHYKPLFDAKKPVTCWVDPDNPAEAIIDRAPRFEQFAFLNLFTFGFALAGIFLLLGALLSLRPEPARNDRQFTLHAHPFWFFAIPAALTLAHTVFLLSKLLPFAPWPWHVWLVPIPACILVPLSLYRHIYNKAFNGARLDVAGPPTLGDALSGALHIPCPVEDEVAVILRCQCSQTTGSGKRRRTSITTLWENEAFVLAVSDGFTTTLPFRMDIPHDQPASTFDVSRAWEIRFTNTIGTPEYVWHVLAKLKHRGLRHTLTFVIPVRPQPPR